MSIYSNASKGLKLMFIAQIIDIISVFVPHKSFNPLYIILSLLTFGCTMFGIYLISTDIDECKKAFLYAVAEAGLHIIYSLSGLGILNLAAFIVDVVIVYYITHGVGEALSDYNCPKLASLGETVFKINCNILKIVACVYIASIVPILGLAVALSSAIFLLIAELAFGILFMFFLIRSGIALA